MELNSLGSIDIKWGGGRGGGWRRRRRRRRREEKQKLNKEKLSNIEHI